MLFQLLLITQLLFHVPTKAEGVAVYEYQSYGEHSYETHLYFKQNRYKYERHERPHTSQNTDGMRFYHYKHFRDWYLEGNDIIATHEGTRPPSIYTKWKANNIAWKITSETRRIAGFEVQKAIAEPYVNDEEIFSYGKVVAWFTTEIPIPLGPEGYDGLPGLIVKLEYEGGNVSNFTTTLKEIIYKPIKKWKVPDLANKVQVTQAQFYNLGTIDRSWLKEQAKRLQKK